MFYCQCGLNQSTSSLKCILPNCFLHSFIDFKKLEFENNPLIIFNFLYILRFRNNFCFYLFELQTNLPKKQKTVFSNKTLEQELFTNHKGVSILNDTSIYCQNQSTIQISLFSLLFFLCLLTRLGFNILISWSILDILIHQNPFGLNLL